MVRKIFLLFLTLSLGLIFNLPTMSFAKSSSKKIINVASDTTFPPFEYEVNGKIKGFDIDLISAVLRSEGFKLKLRSMNFQGLIPALQTGTIDIAVAGITIRPGRAKVVNFAYPYYHSGLSILVKKSSLIKDFPDLKGKIVAVKLGTTADIMMSKTPGVKVQRFSNIDDAYNQLRSSGANAVVFDHPVNLNYAKTHHNVHIVGHLLTSENYGFAITKKEPWLLKVVNKGLKKVYKNGTYTKLYKKYFGNDEHGFVKIVK